jgi:hypothetical protein
MNTDTMPGDAEAAGAIAGMSDTYGYVPRVGDRVRAELPFKDTYGIGTVKAVNPAVIVVEIDGETLWFYPHDLRHAGN